MVTAVVESGNIAINKDNMYASYLRTYLILHDDIARASGNIQFHGVYSSQCP